MNPKPLKSRGSFREGDASTPFRPALNLLAASPDFSPGIEMAGLYGRRKDSLALSLSAPPFYPFVSTALALGAPPLLI
jgi:hypothetical protein